MGKKDVTSIRIDEEFLRKVKENGPEHLKLY